MTDENYAMSPPRLCESEDRIGRLLKRHRCRSMDASAAPPTPPFSQLMELRAQRKRHRARGGLLAAAAAALLLGGSAKYWSGSAFSGFDLFDHALQAARGLTPLESTVPPIAAEAHLDGFRQDSKVEEERPAKSMSDNESAEQVQAVSDSPPSAPIVKTPSSERRVELAPVSGSTRSSAEPSNCAELAALGNFERAVTCYEQQSQGSGMRAELAFLELARLRREHNRDPEGALASLDEYEARFASGTLHPEATLARIRLLVQLGRGQEARDAISMATSKMPEKAWSLREMAVDLAVAEGKCVEAHSLTQRLPAERTTDAWKREHLSECAEKGDESLTPFQK